MASIQFSPETKPWSLDTFPLGDYPRHAWSRAMDVGEWLRGLGLGKYEAAFLDNGIGEAVLPHLTVEDLKEIGVATVGDRRMLLAAIAALATQTSSEPIGPEPSPVPLAKAPEISAERR